MPNALTLCRAGIVGQNPPFVVNNLHSFGLFSDGGGDLRELARAVGSLRTFYTVPVAWRVGARNTCRVVKRILVAEAGESNHLVHNQC